MIKSFAKAERSHVSLSTTSHQVSREEKVLEVLAQKMRRATASIGIAQVTQM